MTQFTPKLYEATYVMIGSINNLIDPADYVNAPIYAGKTYDEVLNLSGTEIPVYVKSFGAGAMSFNLVGSVGTNLIGNTFGYFKIPGARVYGLYRISYNQTRSNPNAGGYSASLIDHVSWDGLKSAIRKVDSPYGDISNANKPNFYTAVNLAAPSTTSVAVTNMWFLVSIEGDAFNNNRESGYDDSYSSVQLDYLAETTGEPRFMDIMNIFTKAVSKTYDAYSGISGNAGAGTTNRNFISIVAVPLDPSKKLNSSREYSNFIKSDYGNSKLQIQFNDGSNYSINRSDYGVSGSGGFSLNSGISASSTGGGIVNYANLTLREHLVKALNYTIVDFDTYDGLKSYAKSYGSLWNYTLAKWNETNSSDFRIPDFSTYAEIQGLIGINIATKYGDFYKKAADLMKNNDELAGDLGWFSNVFNFVIKITEMWETSKIMNIVRAYKSVSAAAEATSSQIHDLAGEVYQPYVNRLKRSFIADARLTYSGKKVGGAPGYENSPEFWADSIGSGNFGYDAIKGVLQRIRVSYYAGTVSSNDYGGSDRRAQDATSFYTYNSDVPLISGCTYHCLPGHVFRLTGNGKEPLTIFKYY